LQGFVRDLLRDLKKPLRILETGIEKPVRRFWKKRGGNLETKIEKPGGSGVAVAAVAWKRFFL